VGGIPAWWQLLKALHELGTEVVVVPCRDECAESLWWHTYGNMPGGFSFPVRLPTWDRGHIPWKPAEKDFKVDGSPIAKLRSLIYSFIRTNAINPCRRKHIDTIIRKENRIDAVLFLSTETYLDSKGLPSFIRKIRDSSCLLRSGYAWHSSNI